MEYIILLLLLGIAGFLVYDKKLRPKDEKEKEIEEKYREKLTDLEIRLKKTESERDELSGKGKEMFVHLTSLKEKNQSLDEKLQEAQKKVTKYESEKDARLKEHQKALSDAKVMEESFKDEKVRIRREDEMRLATEEEERDRMWNEHENACISAMKLVCQKPEFAFQWYDNTSLPSSFDGGMKPDFLVEFLGQYIIFDAKMSRSANLSTYLTDQVKKTVKKIKESANVDEVYSTVFFLIPTVEFAGLKQTHFYEEGYRFYAIPLEAFEPLIACFKRITHYELAESFDPKERENIINLIATYDYHISRQNTINLLTSLEGLKVMHEKGTLTEKMREEVDTLKRKIRPRQFKESDLKRLVQSPEEQAKELKQLGIELTEMAMSNVRQDAALAEEGMGDYLKLLEE